MARLTIEVSGCRNASGRVMVGLVDSPDDFPQPRSDDAWIGVNVPISNGRATATFEDLAPGRYAIACYHDENGNQKLDRNFLGLPKEGFAFGNNAFRMGKPRFDECSVILPEDGLTTQVEIRYLLG